MQIAGKDDDIHSNVVKQVGILDFLNKVGKTCFVLRAKTGDIWSALGNELVGSFFVHMRKNPKSTAGE